VKITVIATGFKSVPQRTSIGTSASAAIASTRAASGFVPATPAPAPRPHPTYQAAAPPAAATRHEAPSLETVKSSVKANYSQDDLDVPAFLRKKGEMQ
jgi:hypothetical protein